MSILPENIVVADKAIEQSYLSTLPDPTSTTYLDEVYTALFMRSYVFHSMRSFETELDEFFDGWLINPYDEVDIEQIVSVARASRFLCSIVYQNLDRLYASIEELENDIIHRGETISNSVHTLSVMIDKVHAAMSRDARMSSILDECIVYDTLDINTFFNPEGATLALDTSTGFISLMPADTHAVGYVIDTPDMFDVPPGSIKETVYGVDTFETIENGYFHGRFFSSSPRMNDTKVSDINAVHDPGIGNIYEVELNTTSIIRSGFRMGLTLRPSSSANVMRIALSLPTTESTFSSPFYQVYCPNIIYDNQNMSNRIFDNRITSEKFNVGSIEPLWGYGDNVTAYKTLVLPGIAAGKELKLQLVTYTPQLASFPEIIFTNQEGKEVSRLNYFETLAVMKYDAPEGTLDPKSLFSPDQLSALSSAVAVSRLNVSTYNATLYRYYFGIRSIELANVIYQNEGEIISTNINKGGKPLASVSIYVNEYVPDGTFIRYFVGVDPQTWIEVEPANATVKRGYPNRVLFSKNIQALLSDVIAPGTVTSLYVRIVMKGNSSDTPLLKSIAVRMKFEAN